MIRRKWAQASLELPHKASFRVYRVKAELCTALSLVMTHSRRLFGGGRFYGAYTKGPPLQRIVFTANAHDSH